MTRGGGGVVWETPLFLTILADTTPRHSLRYIYRLFPSGGIGDPCKLDGQGGEGWRNSVIAANGPAFPSKGT